VAVENNNQEKMKEMIDTVPGIINLMCFACGGTVVHYAVYENSNTETIKFLLNNGADINIYDNDIHTPLWAAVYNGNEEILKILLTDPEADINDSQDALLRTAVEYEKKDIVKFLLSKRGINVNLASPNGWTPLHMAAYYRGDTADDYNNIEIIKLLLRQDEINIHATNGENNTPLDIAIQRSNSNAVLLLLAKIQEKGQKISNAIYEKIKGNSNLYNKSEIRSLAEKLKQNALSIEHSGQALDLPITEPEPPK
jgi:ankyrin repeat protein